MRSAKRGNIPRWRVLRTGWTRSMSWQSMPSSLEWQLSSTTAVAPSTETRKRAVGRYTAFGNHDRLGILEVVLSDITRERQECTCSMQLELRRWVLHPWVAGIPALPQETVGRRRLPSGPKSTSSRHAYENVEGAVVSSCGLNEERHGHRMLAAREISGCGPPVMAKTHWARLEGRVRAYLA